VPATLDLSTFSPEVLAGGKIDNKFVADLIGDH
jgi:hypothetical protein